MSTAPATTLSSALLIVVTTAALDMSINAQSTYRHHNAIRVSPRCLWTCWDLALLRLSHCWTDQRCVTVAGWLLDGAGA
jgi:hypothetical protein